MDLHVVLEKHERTGRIERMNDSTFHVASEKHNSSATVRILPGRATVDFVTHAAVPASVPTNAVLRDQMKKFNGSFYASAHQLDEFLKEMS
ncbi:hypothetical protein [Microbacterium sp. 77mftsu3.1]|uniref:hypothetical protein n=1 Tax=Microbacterium sp. 77mftsu3.1 TaxID=1761802 RepID=UPI000369E92C|nr:hypothetical protein [Microbacterium sp. 77mftsu3.1]SDH33734.1 hypothetical protein SAMN04488590_3064 [Microbacterium sp. 77mftsu3.1]